MESTTYPPTGSVTNASQQFPSEIAGIICDSSSGLASTSPAPSRHYLTTVALQVRQQYSSGGCGGISPLFRTDFTVSST